MDTIKNNLSEEYLASVQLTELIEDIENCALRLVDAARKAKENAKKQVEKTKDKALYS